MMTLQKTTIDPNMSKEAMILYYLFIDEQLLCAWWDYLDAWHLEKELDELWHQNEELRKKMRQTMESVEYWEDILDQLKKHITYEEIEDYLRENPQVKKSFLFIRT